LPSPERGFDYGLLSPATAGSDGIVSDSAVLLGLYDAEVAYLRALVAVGIAPASAAEALEAVGIPSDAGDLARRSRDGGNPVIPFIADLKAAAPDAAAWIHRGATSQDILDTALMLTARRARGLILTLLEGPTSALAALADEHRTTVTAARTLTQHATPTTYGLRFAVWLTSLLDARDALAAVSLPAQLGGASGTLASLVEIAGVETATAMPAAFAKEAGLDVPRSPWQVSRAPVTRLGDALVGLTDVFGTIGANVATLSRTEIAELSEPAAEGRGGSSAMPQKRNPVFSVLLRSVSLRAPGLASTLHVAAASFVDERPDGAWHAEWPTLRELLRLTVGGAARLGELLDGLAVDPGHVAANLALDDLLAEQRGLGGSGDDPAAYLGLSDRIIDAAIERARS
jgi:3-carboxy-cis,cis-muconate cycloisomerase